MAKSTVDKEMQLQLALEACNAVEKPNFTAIARQFPPVHRQTLQRRFEGHQTSRALANSIYRQNLSIQEEEELIKHINMLTNRQIPPTSAIVRNLAEEIAGRPVGKNWTGQFINRHHDRIESLYLRNIDNKRTKAEYAPIFKLFFDLLIEALEKYNITADNLYNWDEKGFILGMAHAVKRIMSLHAVKSGRIMGASQDGSREFLSLLACICADGTKLPPTLIYQGESADLQDSWVEDFNEGDQAYFAATTNGWSCDNLGLQWLQKVFHSNTKDKAGNRRRLLIVDGHSSHVNMKFIDWADKNRIIIAILPPHSTHRLQPLDVGLFQPLATQYSKQISNFIANSFGITSLSKRIFWPLFKASWEASFTEHNIQSAFSKTGIFPYKPEIVLDQIAPPKAPSLSPVQEYTPISCRAIRKLQKAYRQSPTNRRLETILHANIRLATINSINNHTIQGLNEALRYEKKKHSRGKRLNLVGEDDNGPQLFSPSRVQRAKAISLEKQVQEQAERDRIDGKKALALANRIRKEEEKAARAVQASIRKQEVTARKLEKAAQVEARKNQRQAAKEAREVRYLVKQAQRAAPKRKRASGVFDKSLGPADASRPRKRGKTTTSK